MTGLFIKVLNMSITASWCILLIYIGRLLLGRMPKIYSYVLWLVVAFRLVCPFSFESAFSLTGPYIPARLTGHSAAADNFFAMQAPPGEGKDEKGNNITAAGGNTAVNGYMAADSTGFILRAGSIVWIAGIGILVLYSTVSCVRLKKKLSGTAAAYRTYKDKRTGKEIQVWEGAGLETPFVFGFFKPDIYMPAGFSEEEEKYFLLHEAVHIRRGDYLIKQAAFLLTCIHWFNPFVWLAFRGMARDMEMSCDEAVIRDTDMNERKQYSGLLLSLAGGNEFLSVNPLAFGGNGVKRRISNIMNYKKPGFWITVLCIFAVIILAVGLIANPKTVTGQESENQAAVLLEEEMPLQDEKASAEEDNWVLMNGRENTLTASVSPDSLKIRALPVDDAEVVGLLPGGGKVDVIALPDSVWAEGMEEGLIAKDIPYPETEQEKYVCIHYYGGDGIRQSGFVQAKYLEFSPEITKRQRIYWAAKAWGDAFCSRNGAALYAMAADKKQIEEWGMSEVEADGQITFGYSSPWPWKSYTMEMNEHADGESASGSYDVKYRFYAETSDPTVTVWTQEIALSRDTPSTLTVENKTTLDTFTEDVIAGFSEVKQLYDIRTGEAFDEAYLTGMGGLQFFDYEGNGYTAAVVNQLEQSAAGDGQSTPDNSVYQKPDTAAEKYLNLSGGTASIEKESGNTALVRYDFADGSSRKISMYLAVKEPAVWSVGEQRVEIK